MLINQWSVVMILMALASVFLIAYVCINALLIRSKGEKYLNDDYKHGYIDKKIRFVFSAALICMIIKLMSYPLFYVSIQSFVKSLDTAMCMYGVINSMHGSVRYLEVVKPLVFFFAGGWIIFHFLTRHSKNQTIIHKKILFLFFAAAWVLTDSLGDLFLFLNMNPGANATCCSANIDVPGRISHILSVYLFGLEYEKPLWGAYYLGNIMVVVSALYLVYKKINLSRAKKALVCICCMGVINCFISWLAFIELISPELMKLPYHHCLYCLVQYVPDAWFIIGLFFLGCFGPAWALTLCLIGTETKNDDALNIYVNRLYLFTATCLGLSLLMVSIHILLGGLKT